ncbi:MAG: CDP-alcohol phosphatidyltransferase family protein [Saprospiraceae bacterium]|nr:CDP-alcohol phosphatidyltransferase family protein [Saprospiraceae bacterium]
MIKKHIPNAITLLNLFCGCIALVCIFQQAYVAVAVFTGIGLIADFLDGAVARLLNVTSELGKQLDSLADMVSFGVVPGAIFYQLLSTAFHIENFLDIRSIFGFVITIFACLRLAKFNLDARQSQSFLGLPTPAVTIFVIGLMLIVHFDSFGLRPMVLQPWLLYSCIAALSWLMVSELPMFSLKFARFTWKGNEIKFIFAATAAALLIFLKEAAFSLIILIYIVFSIVQYRFKP